MLRFKGDSTSVKTAFDLKSKKKKSKKEKKKDKKNLKSQQDSDSDNSDAASESDGVGLPSVFKRKKVDDIDEQLQDSKKKTKKQKKDNDKDKEDDDNGDLSLQKPHLTKEQLQLPSTHPTTRLQGSGRIVCTSDTVSGFNCKFHEELQPLDMIEILHPATLQIETRVVDQVLGNRSCLLKEPFSRNFSTTTEYTIIKTSESLSKKVSDSETGGANLDTKKSKAKKKKLKKSKKTKNSDDSDSDPSSEDDSEGDENDNIQILRDDFGHPIESHIIGNTNSASSTDGPHSDLRTIQVREKTGSGGGGSYRTVAKQIQGGATNALEERMKQGRDKFCW